MSITTVGSLTVFARNSVDCFRVELNSFCKCCYRAIDSEDPYFLGCFRSRWVMNNERNVADDKSK